MEFGRNLNVICGQNGSGKSSIISALALALGSSIRATDQGTALKDVIRTGCQAATIKLWLANSNDKGEAYEYDKYGDSIVVVRHITKSSATYKLESANGVLISKKRADLQKLLDYFNIKVSCLLYQPMLSSFAHALLSHYSHFICHVWVKVENPCCIMDQEQVKTFLRNAKPEQLFKFFLQATLLEKIRVCDFIIYFYVC